MKVYGPARRTHVETIQRYGKLADRDESAEVAAQQWTQAGFDDATTARWLHARCFDPQAASGLSELGLTPEQCAGRTRDGGGGYIDTIGYKVANGDLTVRQGAARALSSR